MSMQANKTSATTVTFSQPQEMVISHLDDSIKIGDGVETAEVTAANALKTDSSHVTQPISATSLPLPTGAATSANQTSTNTKLDSLLTELQLKADLTETQPVSAASLPLPTGAATEAKQDTANTKLDSLLTELQLKADLTETQPVSAASLPLPTGAATETKQDTTNTKLDSLLAELQLKADLTEVQPVSLASVPLSSGAATEAKQDVGNASLASMDAKLTANLSVSTDNSSTAALNDTQSYTGTWEDVTGYNSVTVALKTDRPASMYIQFSPDASNVDSSLYYSVEANINEVHRLTVTRRYFRVLVYNNSGVNQTFLRLQTLKANQQLLTSNVNSTIQDDADAIVTRSILYTKDSDNQFSVLRTDSNDNLKTKLDVTSSNTLKAMLIELKKINLHLRTITGIDAEDEEV